MMMMTILIIMLLISVLSLNFCKHYSTYTSTYEWQCCMVAIHCGRDNANNDATKHAMQY